MNEDKTLFHIGSAPHIGSHDTTRRLMLDVIIALIPAIGVATFFFGFRVLALCAVSVIFCVLFEFLYRMLMKKPQTIGDLSACITGLLLAMSLPATTPYWALAVGAFFAIVIVKQLYGGIGKNFMNPALAARVFMFISFPGYVNTWSKPLSTLGVFDDISALSAAGSADAITSATPMMMLHDGILPLEYSYREMLAGQRPGSLGEAAIVALVLGGLYLLFRKVITLRIPATFIGTVAVLTFFFPQGGNAGLTWMAYQLLGGGLIMGAFFMATDYSTSPVTRGGQWIYGIGCGLLTVFIRYFGSYPEGVSFAILIMNSCVWLFDKWGKPRRFGAVKAPKKAKKAKEAAKDEN